MLKGQQNMDLINYIGYHGTDQSLLEKIENNGFNSNHSNSFLPCDLGPGVYMYIARPGFPNNEPKNNAKKYVQSIKRRYANPIVLEIKTEFENQNKILDMNDPSNQSFFLDFKEKNLEKIEQIFKKLNKNQTKLRGKIDGLILDLMIKNTSSPIDAIIVDSYTPFDFRGYKQSNIPNGREMCLRNPQSIISYSISL
ncbi:hypothetical protein ACOY18_11200 [Enterococcus hirae]